MLELLNLTFSYDNNRILFENASISLTTPGLYYLDGKNGTGKTTLFKILKGIIKTNREVVIDNSINSFEKITYINYQYIINNRLKVIDYLLLFNNELNYVNELLNIFSLDHVKNKYVRTLSDGEKTRLAFIAGILEGNDIILIDEIFSHLDKNSTKLVKKVISRLKETKIIIITSHKDNFNIDYDYLIKIVNKKIEITKNENNLSNEKVILPKVNINNNILKKVINFKLRYVFILFLVFLSLTTAFFFYLTRFKETKLEYEMLQNSESIPYIVSNVYKNELEDLSHDNLQVGLNSNINMIVSNKADEPLISTYDLDREIHVDDFFHINRIIITDKYKDKVLNDNDIVISDFLLEYIKINSKIYPGVYKYSDKDVSIKFKAFKANVVDVFNTKYDSVTEIDILGNDKDYILINNANKKRANYLYYMIYMNASSYEQIVSTQIHEIKTNNFYDINKNQVKLSVAAKDNIIEGRMPLNEDEVVVPLKLKDFYKLDSVSYLNFYSGKDTDFSFDYDNLFFLGYVRSVRNRKTVVGYNLDSTIGFYDDKALEDYILTYVDYYETKAIDVNNLTYEDFLKIKDKNYRIMMSNIDEYDLALAKLVNSRHLNNMLSYIFLAVLLLFIFIYLVIEYVVLYKDYYSLKQKNIKKEKINKLILKFNIKSFVLLLVLTTISLLLIFKFNFFDIIIFKYLNIV